MNFSFALLLNFCWNVLTLTAKLLLAVSFSLSSSISCIPCSRSATMWIRENVFLDTGSANLLPSDSNQRDSCGTWILVLLMNHSSFNRMPNFVTFFEICVCSLFWWTFSAFVAICFENCVWFCIIFQNLFLGVYCVVFLECV